MWPDFPSPVVVLSQALKLSTHTGRWRGVRIGRQSEVGALNPGKFLGPKPAYLGIIVSQVLSFPPCLILTRIL